MSSEWLIPLVEPSLKVIEFFFWMNPAEEETGLEVDAGEEGGRKTIRAGDCVVS